jgi:aspartate aminotransferase
MTDVKAGGTPPIPSSTGTMTRSGIRVIMDRALKNPGSIRLELGEPDFPTAPNIVEAAHRAARNGFTKYTTTMGIPVLRDALSEKIERRNGFAVSGEAILVSSGAVQGLYAALVGLVDPGDNILLPSPGWPNYGMMCRLLRAESRGYPLRASSGYLPEIEDLEALVDSNTRVIVLNSPSNPLGAVINETRLSEILDFAARRDLWVVSDECYDELTYDSTHVSPARLDERESVITVFSFSKTYAMTGWRIGYVALPQRVAATLANVHETMISCVAMPTQLAALEAVTGPQDMVAQMRDTYRMRRDNAMDALSARGIPAFRPSGAFYLWIDISASGLNGTEFAERLVDERGVAVAPGPTFGSEGASMVRMSIAADPRLIGEGIARLSRLISDLSG